MLIEFVLLNTVDAAAVEDLLDRAFGVDRFARTAYTIRGSALPIAALSFAAVDDRLLVGTIQCWPVQLAADDGDRHEMVMIGPVAVAPGRQRDGIGRMLMTHMLLAARATHRDAAMMLIGDPEYYGRFFGFSAERTGNWRLPGPVERRRLLAKGESVPAVGGELGPRIDSDA